MSKYLQWEGVGEELAKQEENKCKVPELGVLLGHCMNSKETRGSGEDSLAHNRQGNMAASAGLGLFPLLKAHLLTFYFFYTRFFF